MTVSTKSEERGVLYELKLLHFTDRAGCLSLEELHLVMYLECYTKVFDALNTVEKSGGQPRQSEEIVAVRAERINSAENPLLSPLWI